MKNESAFPTGIITDDKGMIIGGSNGMTLRDYFAAKAMPILLAEKYDDGPAFEAEEVAELAYTYADAMLEARLK